MSTYRSSQRISLFTNATSSDQIQQPSESPKAPSSILSLNSLHSTLLLLYSPQLYETNSTPHSQCSVLVPSQAVPQATRSRAQCQDILQTTTPFSLSPLSFFASRWCSSANNSKKARKRLIFLPHVQKKSPSAESNSDSWIEKQTLS